MSISIKTTLQGNKKFMTMITEVTWCLNNRIDAIGLTGGVRTAPGEKSRSDFELVVEESAHREGCSSRAMEDTASQSDVMSVMSLNPNATIGSMLRR